MKEFHTDVRKKLELQPYLDIPMIAKPQEAANTHLALVLPNGAPASSAREL